MNYARFSTHKNTGYATEMSTICYLTWKIHSTVTRNTPSHCWLSKFPKVQVGALIKLPYAHETLSDAHAERWCGHYNVI